MSKLANATLVRRSSNHNHSPLEATNHKNKKGATASPASTKPETEAEAGEGAFSENAVRYVVLEMQIAASAFPPLWQERQLLYRQVVTQEMVHSLPFPEAALIKLPESGYFSTQEEAEQMRKVLAKVTGIGWTMTYKVEVCYPGLSSFEQLCQSYRLGLNCKLTEEAKANHIQSYNSRLAAWEERFRQRYRVRVKLASEGLNEAKLATDLLYNYISEEYLVIEKVFDSPSHYDNLYHGVGWLLLTPSEEDFLEYLYSSGLQVYNNWSTAPGERVKIWIITQKEMIVELERASGASELEEELPPTWERLDEWLVQVRQKLSANSRYTPPDTQGATDVAVDVRQPFPLDGPLVYRELNATTPATRAWHAQLGVTFEKVSGLDE